MMIESKSDFRYSHLRSLLVGRSVKIYYDVFYFSSITYCVTFNGFQFLLLNLYFKVTMSCALMANYYISWRLQNIVTSSKYINIQPSRKVRLTSCYSILMTSHYFEVSKIQSNKPLRLPHGVPVLICVCRNYFTFKKSISVSVKIS